MSSGCFSLGSGEFSCFDCGVGAVKFSSFLFSSPGRSRAGGYVDACGVSAQTVVAATSSKAQPSCFDCGVGAVKFSSFLLSSPGRSRAGGFVEA